MVSGQVKNICDLAKQLEVIDCELEQSPSCYIMLQQKADTLQDLVDRSRSALVLTAADARRAKREREENGCRREKALNNINL